jgi:deoxyribodipyrimidine photo-lyase
MISIPSAIPSARLRALNRQPVRVDAAYVVYVMGAARRLTWNFALEHAALSAAQMRRPLLVVEPLLLGETWASHRRHAFAFDGMREHAEALTDVGVSYYPFVERRAGEATALLTALSASAVQVVGDDVPIGAATPLLAQLAKACEVRVEVVDSNGLLPMRSAGRDFTAAVHFRRHLHKQLAPHLIEFPRAEPLRLVTGMPSATVASDIAAQWPAVGAEYFDRPTTLLGSLAYPCEASPVDMKGGARSAHARLQAFLETKLRRYADDRNHPDDGAASGLSPWLHWGHISAHEIFSALAEREGWSPARLSGAVTAKREGWWGMSPAAEAFLDELVTWREIGFNFAVENPDYDRYESLPEWARATLEEHAADPRPEIYDLEQLDAATTYDKIWNAAQRQLRREGVMENYLRMLWGKRVIEWTQHPKESLQVMIELNNRYALDGCDPNSYSGIFWVLGRFDRAWTERAIYGKVRYMSSDATRRKLKMTRYLSTYGREA